MAKGRGEATPVRRAEARVVRENPDGAVEPLVALRTVVLYTVTDAFGLVVEEVMWAGYHLDRVLAPLLGKAPQMVPLAVRQEMLEGTYSAALETLESRDGQGASAAYDPQVVHATIQDWAGVIMQMITTCYPLRPMDESSMHGQIVGLLRELGVSDPSNPRPARYLPNDVRHRLVSRSHTD
jgi:hypothetical protein